MQQLCSRHYPGLALHGVLPIFTFLWSQFHMRIVAIGGWNQDGAVYLQPRYAHLLKPCLNADSPHNVRLIDSLFPLNNEYSVALTVKLVKVGDTWEGVYSVARYM